ncbi:MAG: hypothetical protein Q8P12_02315, partial [bacterium]|nr:hypothetical protein [bacterium]
MAFRIQDVISQLGEVGSRVVGAARDNPNLTAGILGGIGTIAAGRYGGSPGIRALGSAVEAVGEKRKKDELDRVRKVKDELERQRAEKLLLDADLSMQERQHRMDISEREQSRKDLEGWDNLFDDNSGKKGRSRGGLSGMPGKLSFATPVSPPSLDEAGVLSLSEKDAGKIQGEANKLAAMLKKERFTLNDVQDSWRKIAGSEDFKGYHGPNGEETVASKLLRKK